MTHAPTIYYRTNLDDMREVDRLNDDPPGFIPAVGMTFEFALHNGRGYTLEVVGIKYVTDRRYIVVELHIPSGWGMSIADWQRFMQRQRGGQL